MRTAHRVIAVFAVLAALWVGLTGVTIQLIDLKALLSHAPASDPNIRAIRDGHNGPPNFQVLGDGEYDAAVLPAGLDYGAALATVVKAARAAVPGAPLGYVELRVRDGKPVGEVASKKKVMRFDAATGAVLIGPEAAGAVKMQPLGRPSLRNTVKNIHRLTQFGDAATLLDPVMGLLICAMIFTGLVQYFRLLAARARLGRANPLWSAGGLWRSLHRGVAIAASLFLTVMALSGTLLAIGDVGVSAFRVAHHGDRSGANADQSSPLTDAELPGMLRTTLSAFHAARPDAPIRVLRLRYYAGMPQGVVVFSGPREAEQVQFNAATGRAVSLTEPNYPATGQPFGWQEDQIVKQIHRGDFIGLSGRWMSLLGGLSLVFLALSGTAMYLDLWSRRRRAGRAGLFWT
ncbi:MAG TPA: PepSY-associated TM helix domain-containing protein [Caulobacteraceae bacterium]|nr:PepSY-associated TM helix domain-containing protein [Caulobacteraceae bacterium]